VIGFLAVYVTTGQFFIQPNDLGKGLHGDTIVDDRLWDGGPGHAGVAASALADAVVAGECWRQSSPSLTTSAWATASRRNGMLQRQESNP